MRTLTKNEWIAVVIAIVVAGVLLGARFFVRNDIEMADLETNIKIETTKTIEKNMDTSSNTGGLIINEVLAGTGAEAKNGNIVSVQYTGKLADGKVFDSSIPRGKPIEFILGEGMVIKGWDQGILGMKVGGKRTLQIAPELAYGAREIPGVIPANSTLFFDVELVGVKVQ